MDTLRRRVPFKAAEGEEGEEERILDEQEQEELIQVLLGLSLTAQITYLFSSTKQTPLANIFPISPPNNTPIPLSTPVSFALTYALSAVGPTLSLFLGKPWQTTGWWMASLVIAYVTHTESRNGVAEVEGMRYVAPGA
ncbi:hypothetical protein FA13DRAFT_1724020 [Coprinellus micaceus]|uniref:Uncharacterized protein n=1 Tax=Coprinellus micaceus TaxID=71717 RepID=A0A4Y7U1T1_COPMI|nr:hypothetical protein FA13DRAFT_1724020 [Coprinellus micaceus]